MYSIMSIIMKGLGIPDNFSFRFLKYLLGMSSSTGARLSRREGLDQMNNRQGSKYHDNKSGPIEIVRRVAWCSRLECELILF